MRRQPDVERKEHRSGFHARCRRSSSLEKAVTVQALKKRHAIARLHSHTPEGPRKPGNAVCELRVGNAIFSAHHCNLLWELLLCVTQEAQWSERDIHCFFAPSGGLASVNHQHMAGDIVGSIRSQEYRHAF